MALMREELVERFGNQAALAESADMLTTKYGERTWAAVPVDQLVGAGDAIKPILGRIFELLDQDGNGYIEEREGLAAGKALFSNVHKAKQWWDELLVYADNDMDQRVRLQEWCDFQLENRSDQPLAVARRELQQMLEELEANKARVTLQKRRFSDP